MQRRRLFSGNSAIRCLAKNESTGGFIQKMQGNWSGYLWLIQVTQHEQNYEKSVIRCVLPTIYCVSLQFAKNPIIHLSKKPSPKIQVFNRGEL